MDFRDIAHVSLRSIRKAAVGLLAIIRNRRLDRGDTYPQSYKASDSQIKVMDALGVLAKALYELPSGFLAYERVLPPEMTEAEAEELIQRGLADPDPYAWISEKYPWVAKPTPEETARRRAAWIEDVRSGTKPIPDARPMLDGEEFLDADEAHKLLYAVHSALCSAGWLRCDIRPAPVKVEAAVVEKLERGIELLSRFEEQAGGAAVDDQASGKPPEDQADEDQEDRLEWSKPVGYKVLRKTLGDISQKTLKARLVESSGSVVGKIRYKAPHAKARLIQVVVSDLPADEQARFRQTSRQAST